MTIDSMKLGLPLIWLILASWAGSAVAQEVYRTVSADGVVTFSDQASVGAERLVLPGVAGADKSALAAQQALIEQQLEVARVLEESRLAREDARIRRLEAQAAQQPQTVYYPVAQPSRYVGGLVSYRSVGPYRQKHHRGSWKRDKSWPGGPDGGYGGHDGGYGGHPPATGPGGGDGHGRAGGSRAHGSSLLAPP